MTLIHNSNKSNEPFDGIEVSLRDHLTLWIQRVEQSLTDKINSLERITGEKDTLYQERFASAKALVDQAFTASEKAILKAEIAQKLYDTGHNDLIIKMDKQQQGTVPRLEVDSRIISAKSEMESELNSVRVEFMTKHDALEKSHSELRKELETMRTFRDQSLGSGQKQAEDRQDSIVNRAKSEFNLTTLISIAALALAIFLALKSK